MNSNIFVFSRPVRSGKTTQLQQWLQTGIDAAGILTPDVEGRRMIYDIRNKSFHTFEVDETYGGEKITIGKFLFAKTAFALAQDIIRKAVAITPAWLLIDEVGKLETEQGEGLEPAVLQTIAAYRQQKNNRLLLVIRDTLLEQALRKYALYGCNIINQSLPV